MNRLEDLIVYKEVFENSDINHEGPADIINPIIPEYLLNDPQIVGFPDLEMQQDLYQYAISNVLPLVQDQINPITVVDIGAGRGDLKGYLDAMYPENFEYYGYEINETLRNAAKQKYRLDLREKFQEDTERFHGWAFCIGSLNNTYGLFTTDEKYIYITDLIHDCLERISLGMVFILLDTNTDSVDLVDFPMVNLLMRIQEYYPNIPFSIDYTRFEGIYKLVIHNTRFS